MELERFEIDVRRDRGGNGMHTGIMLAGVEATGKA